MKAAEVLEKLAAKNAPVLNLLAECRIEENRTVWREGPELSIRFSHLLLKQGHPTLALECAARSLELVYPGNHDLMYFRALALARCGNPTRARWYIDQLLKLDLGPSMRSDALSLAGRVRKDLAGRTADPAVRTRRFREAFEFYHQAYQLQRDTFPGINAATLALLAGDPALSRRLATEVRDLALDQLDQPDAVADAWTLATLGEAFLLLGDLTAAKGRYSQAVGLERAAGNDGNIESMHRQLRLVQSHLPIDRAFLSLFRVGPVVIFAGHSLDRPGDPTRFPNDPALETLVKRAIRNELDALEPTIGYYSPACGSDLLFGELMQERDAETHMVLPFSEEDFISDRLTYDIPEFAPWQQRFEKLRGFLRVTRHFATTEQFLNHHVLYDFTGSFTQGLALIRAAQIGTDAIAIVVQDPTPRPTASGLNTFVESWRRTGKELRVIDLAEVRKRWVPTPVASISQAKTPLADDPITARFSKARIPPRTIKSMLFADVAGFSGLTEAHLPVFFMEFLAVVDDELKSTPPLFKNTWGDGLYIVFDSVVTAADYSLRLLKRLETFNFKEFSFQLKEDKQPGIRIGLHTGPVFEGWDAIIGKNNYFGSHVSRAARIEPVTMPGTAFVSEQFAAALALEPDHDFLCEYLGLIPLAKEYDVCHLYRLTTRLDHSTV